MEQRCNDQYLLLKDWRPSGTEIESISVNSTLFGRSPAQVPLEIPLSIRSRYWNQPMKTVPAAASIIKSASAPSQSPDFDTITPMARSRATALT